LLGAFAQAFRTPDLRRKLLFTLFIMAAFRLRRRCLTSWTCSRAVLCCSSRSSRWALCPTSPRRLSSSCCGSWFPDSTTYTRKDRRDRRSWLSTRATWRSSSESFRRRRRFRWRV